MSKTRVEDIEEKEVLTPSEYFDKVKGLKNETSKDRIKTKKWRIKMDLGAYAQIEDLENIAKDNGIEVPRLRGYRLMKKEHWIDYSDLFNSDRIDIERVEYLCEAHPFWSANPESWELSGYTDYLKHFFLEYKENEPIKVRWNRIHGWKRKKLKLMIHNKKKAIKTQYDIWNKYVGRDDILYIHARIGGGNWHYYHKYVDEKEWFIEKVDDAYDSTYCDIYAKIKPV